MSENDIYTLSHYGKDNKIKKLKNKYKSVCIYYFLPLLPWIVQLETRKRKQYQWRFPYDVLCAGVGERDLRWLLRTLQYQETEEHE